MSAYMHTHTLLTYNFQEPLTFSYEDTGVLEKSSSISLHSGSSIIGPKVLLH